MLYDWGWLQAPFIPPVTRLGGKLVQGTARQRHGVTATWCVRRFDVTTRTVSEPWEVNRCAIPASTFGPPMLFLALCDRDSFNRPFKHGIPWFRWSVSASRAHLKRYNQSRGDHATSKSTECRPPIESTCKVTLGSCWYGVSIKYEVVSIVNNSSKPCRSDVSKRS